MHTATAELRAGGEKILELPIERRDRLFKHTFVGWYRRAAEVPSRARPSQFERASAFLDAAIFCRQRWLGDRPAARGLFLLGFNRLGFEPSCHASIVRRLGSAPKGKA